VRKPLVKPLGDRGILLEYGEGVSLRVNAQVHAAARLIDQATLPGVLETIPAYRSLLVVYDPLVTDFETLEHALAELEGASTPQEESLRKTIDVPVRYGGEFGPDLEFVAELAGLSCDRVVAIHSAQAYRVFLMGFTPGFPFLGPLPELLRAPRLGTPRTAVPAGSVGIADLQTGIYPVDSPGGWRIIGRTPLKLFNLSAENPFLCASGDQVRFRPISDAEFEVRAQRAAGL
jgi:inhibitor of KinA